MSTKPSSSTPMPGPTVPALQTQLHARLLTLAKRSDPGLAKADRILSASSSLDLNLMTLQYALVFVSESITTVHNRRVLRQVYIQLSTLLNYFSRGAGLAVVTADVAVARPAVAVRMRTLSSLISDIRIFNRLWGLIGLLRWAIATLQSPPKDALLAAVAYLQVISNLLYQPLENIAYLGSHDIIPVSKAKINRLWVLSSRLWAAHVILEFVRLGRQKYLAAAVQRHEVGEKAKAKTESNKAAEELWRRQLLVNTAYFPLTIHWSTQTGFLSELAVGALGTVAGGARLIPLWKQK
ncbi:hypothetical protein V1525DRAFT_394830 [Lipomyces kononenkoae]|uniref:Uncharacterized protein n=1 Tax=Lipomyces kononenkoae TaxID=34357 RepID=A0ACC3T9X7_LIPKO